MSQIISTLLFILISAVAGGVFAKFLRLPLILGYIAVGVAIGNVFGGFVDKQLIDAISEGGVTLLLFTLGLEFSFQRLTKTLRIVSWGAALQILFSFLLFLLLFLWIGFAFLPAMFFAIAGSLSSTAVVMRLLTERGESETVPGEVLSAWLVIQDLAVIPIMMILPAIAASYLGGSASIGMTMSIIGVNILKATIAIGAIILLGCSVFPSLLSYIAKIGSREIFLVTVVGMVFLSASVAYAVGLSAALGAFIAGLLISETSQNHAIFSEIRPLRDIFAVVFFVSLGMALPVSLVLPMIATLVGATIVIFLTKLCVVYPITRFLGYHRKTAFLVALGLTQMSEFGFIIAREGRLIGALSHQQYALLVALVFTTIMVSTPLFGKGQTVYYRLLRLAGRHVPRFFPDKKEEELFGKELALRDHVVICGYGRVGKYIGRALQMVDVPFIVVDYNQATVASLREKGIPVIYGDPADIDVLDYAQIDYARSVIIAIPDRHTQEMVIANAQTLNKHISIICRTHHEEDQVRLKTLGVSTIIQPEFEASMAMTTKLYREYAVPEEEIPGKLQRLKIEHGMG